MSAPLERTTTVEWYSQFVPTDSAEYAMTTNAFMNTQGGTIYFGVSASGSFVGCYMDAATAAALRVCFDRIQRKMFATGPFRGHIDIEIDRKNYGRNMGVVTVRVHREAGDHPLYYAYIGGAAFRRLTCQNVQADFTEFVPRTELFQAQARVVELENRLARYEPVEMPQDDLARHLRENLNIKSAFMYAKRALQYEAMSPELRSEVESRDRYIRQLKQENLNDAAHIQKLANECARNRRIMSRLAQELNALQAARNAP